MKTEQFLNRTPAEVCGCRTAKGDLFGVELELEGRGVALQDVATRGWTRHHDGSLRGESNEFCTAGPKTFTETQKLVTELFKKFKDNGVKINDSIRTSTHVHLNFGDKTMKQVVNFFVLFTVLEEVLAYYSGEDRKGNVFCLSTRDAEGIVNILAEALTGGDFHKFAGDRYKYAACNLSALFKFGTVEIRTMRGAKTADEVNNWVSILNDLYQYALKMKSPAEAVNSLSYLGAEGLMRAVFKKENFDELMKAFPKPRTLHASLMEGARMVQVFAYEFDPAFHAEVKIEERKAAPVGPLPITFTPRPGGLQHYVTVYRRGGGIWTCVPILRGRGNDAFWIDGEPCNDNRNIVWRENLGRFVERWRGQEILLNWCMHPQIADEGPPLGVFDGVEPEEPEHWEPDFDDEEI